MSLKGNTALVTGASSGIGLEFANQLAAMGINLVITARRTDRLEQLARDLREVHQVEVSTITLDLSKAEAPKALYELTEGAGKHVDILVNNAGFGTQNPLSEIPWEKTREQLQLNVVSLTELTKRFLNPMLERKKGHILNVASIGAYVPTPYYATYTAGKAYVRNLTEALAYEVRGSGVRLCCLCPGPTTSEFLVASGHGTLPPGSQLIYMSAARCARIGLRALFGWRVNTVSGWLNRIMMFGLRFLPRWLMVRVGAATMGPRT